MKWFKPEEFACSCGKCGLGIGNISPSLLAILDPMREAAGVPMKINSAVRCPEWNAHEGGKVTSSHLAIPNKGILCTAVDIATPGSAHRFRIVMAALACGVRRIGIGNTFVHLDVDPDKPQEVLWLY